MERNFSEKKEMYRKNENLGKLFQEIIIFQKYCSTILLQTCWEAWYNLQVGLLNLFNERKLFQKDLFLLEAIAFWVVM